MWRPKKRQNASVADISPGKLSDSIVGPHLLSGRIRFLDGFRAIAVILVLIAHCVQLDEFADSGHFRKVLLEGQIGVDVFFVLSGFLITTLLIREHHRTGTTAIGSFYFRRCFRILPAYFAFLGVVFVLEKNSVPQLNQLDWLGALTYTTNFISHPSWRLGHLWSLSIEEHFYLVWPFAFAWVSPRKRWVLPVVCIALSLLIRFVCYVQFTDSAWMCNRWTFTRCSAISVGCLLAILVAGQNEFRFLMTRLGRAVHPAVYIAMLIGSIALSRVSYCYAIIPASLVNGLLIGGCIWGCLVRETCRSVTWLDHKFLSVVGVRSYSIYLWQQLILAPGQQLVGGSLFLTFGMVFLMAEASWRLVEQPLLRWKQSKLPTTQSPAEELGPQSKSPSRSAGKNSLEYKFSAKKDLANV